MATKLCNGGVCIITPSDHLTKEADSISYMKAREDEHGSAAIGIRKRLRLRCPECGRSMVASITVCDDGCCFFQSIPPHKPKGWWKKGLKRKKT